MGTDYMEKKPRVIQREVVSGGRRLSMAEASLPTKGLMRPTLEFL